MRGLRVVLIILVLITFTASACALTWPFVCTAVLVPVTYGTPINATSAWNGPNFNVLGTNLFLSPYTPNSNENTSTSTPITFTSTPSLGIGNSFSSFPSLSLDTPSWATPNITWWSNGASGWNEEWT